MVGRGRYHLGKWRDELKKNEKLFTIAGVHAEILTWTLPNEKQNFSSLDTLVCGVVLTMERVMFPFFYTENEDC